MMTMTIMMTQNSEKIDSIWMMNGMIIAIIDGIVGIGCCCMFVVVVVVVGMKMMVRVGIRCNVWMWIRWLPVHVQPSDIGGGDVVVVEWYESS
jgi:ABC-type lipoprotein release transport system permease subunit